MASWIDQANGGSAEDEPPRAGRGATTAAWREYAVARGYEVPKGMGRDAIIDMVHAGPPPAESDPAGRSGLAEGPIYQHTVASVEAGRELGQITDADAGTVHVLLDLARRIDGMDARRAAKDNVTVPVYLKFAEQLGLTPASRARLPKTGDGGGSKLSKLRSDNRLRLVQGAAS